MNRIAFITFITMGLLLTTCGDSSTEPNEIPRFMLLDVEPSWSPDGEWIVYSHSQFYDCDGNLTPDTSGLYMIKSDGSNKTLFIPGFFNNPDWAPDGEWVAFGTGAQIYKIKSDGDSLTQLTTEGRNFFPAWSSDGLRIVFDSDINDTKYDIWIMDSDGTNKINISGESDSIDQGGWRNPDWSPDGKLIAHERYISGGVIGTEIFVMDTSGTNSIILSPGGMPIYSRDGTKILIVVQPEGSFPQLWKMGSDGENKKQLTQNSGWTGDWSPDGQQIVFTNPDNGRLWLMDSDGSNWRQLTYPENDSICLPEPTGPCDEPCPGF